MKRDSVKALLKYLSASFPNQLEFPKGDKERDKMIVDTWYDWLKPVAENKAKIAVKQAAFKNPQWVPSPASILRAVQKNNSDFPNPNEAWQLARQRQEYLEERSMTQHTKGDIRVALATKKEVNDTSKISDEEVEKEYKRKMPDKVEVPDIIKEAMDRFDEPLTGKVNDMHFIRNQFIKTYKEVLEERESEIGLQKYITSGENPELLEVKNE